MIKSRFGWSIYVLLLIFIALTALAFYFFIHLVFYFFTHIDLDSKGKEGYNMSAIFGCFILVLEAFIFLPIAKKIFVVRITNEAIFLKGLFSKRTLLRKEIRSINLLAIHNAVRLKSTISTIIQMENGSTYIIEDPFYENIHIIKQYLDTNYADKIISPRKPTLNISNLISTEERFERISGNHFSSLSNIVCALFAIFCIILGVKIPSAIVVLLFTIAVMYFLMSFSQHYFLLSNEKIIVKNSFLPWIQKTYRYSELLAINIELPERSSVALRITTDDFKSRSFGAESLRKKDWMRLTEILQHHSLNFLYSPVAFEQGYT